MGFWDCFPFLYSPGGWKLRAETKTDDHGQFVLVTRDDFTHVWVVVGGDSYRRTVITRRAFSNGMEIVATGDRR
jgi:hypothetical protein